MDVISSSRLFRRRIGSRLFLLSIALLAGNPAYAVNTNFDVATDGDLINAINTIDGLMPAPGDTASITFTANITLTNNLPLIIAPTNLASISINTGNAPFTLDGGGAFSGFFVHTGTVNIGNLTIQNTRSQGGNGGVSGAGGGGALGAGSALFVGLGTTVALNDVSFIGNIAAGGTGGATNIAAGGGGGGGGMLGGLGGSSIPGGKSVGGAGGGGIGPTATGGNASTGIAGAGGAGLATDADGGGDGANGGVGGIAGGGGGAGDDDAGGGGGIGGLNGTINGPGGNGGFGGGGGGGHTTLITAGGGGGFGGGGGGGVNNAAPGGFGAGAGGGAVGVGGSGGSGFGGAVFVAGTLTINNTAINTDFTANTVFAGAGTSGGIAGAAEGQDLYTMAGSTVSFNPGAGLSQTLNDTIGGPNQISLIGPGTLNLLSTNTYSGGTNINAGVIAINQNTSLGLAGTPVNINGGSLLFSIGGITLDAARLITLSGAGGGINAANGTTSTVAGQITGNSPLTINSGGQTGTVVLSFVGNTNPGGVTINSGILQAGVVNVLPASSPMNILTGAIFDLNNNNQIIAGLSGGGDVNLGSASLTLGATTNTTFGGAIVGTGSVTKEGTSTLGLSGNNTFGGGLNILNGTVQTNAVNTLPSGGAVNVQGTLNLNNNAQVIGDLTGSGLVTLGTAILTLGTGAPTNTFDGVISGLGGIVKQGTGILILTGLNTYAGGTTVSLGALQGNTDSLQGNITNNATLIFDQAVTGTYASTINGTGSLIKQNSGDLILTNNNTCPGGTNINGGRLSVNGVLTSPVTVNSGATLGGIGTINGNVINNGTVSAGNSIGTLAINGNYSPTGSGITAIEINPQGQTSLLNISGIASLNGFLQITADPGQYVAGSQYQFLTASSVVGQFSSFTPNVGAFPVQLVYNGTSVIAVIGTAVTPIVPKVIPTSPTTPTTPRKNISGSDPNEIAIASYIDGLPTPPVGSDFANNVLGPLTNGLSGQALNDALDSISAGKNAANNLIVQDDMMLVNGISAVRLATLRQYKHEEIQSGALLPSHKKNMQEVVTGLGKESSSEALLKRKNFNTTRNAISLNAAQQMQPMLSIVKGNCGGVWLYSFGQATSQKSTRIDPGFHAKSAGVLAGVDISPAKDLFFGMGFGQIASMVNLSKQGGKNRISNYVATLYGTYAPQNWYFDAALTAGYAKYHTRQHIAFLNLNRNALGHHNGRGIAPHLGLGYTFVRGSIDENPLYLTPFANVDYGYNKENAYVTNGALSIDQTIRRRSASLLRSEAGVKLAKSFPICTNLMNGYWVPTATVSYVNKTPIKKGPTQAGFIGQPGFYTVEYFTKARNYVAPGLGITIGFEDRAFITTQLDGEFGSGYQSGEASIKVGVSF